MHPSHAVRTQIPADFVRTAVAVEKFEAHHLTLIEEFSRRYWTRPTDPSFLRWRYLDSLAFSETFVAVGGDHCFGTVSALRKPYLIAGQPARCLEVFDWHCLPGLRGSGVGIRLMRAMMRAGDPVISIGGTADVVLTLPAMGWQRIATARNFELPLAGAYVQPGLRRRLHVRVPGEGLLGAVVVSTFAPRRRSTPAAGAMTAQPAFDPALAALYERPGPYDLCQVPSTPVLEWMTRRPGGASRFTCLTFTDDTDVRGWALTRTYETPSGREGAIVDVWTPRPSVELYTWFVSEAAVLLAADHPRVIRARATCPLLQAALQRNRFRVASEVPIHRWPPTSAVACRPHFTLNHADGPLRPYVDGAGDHSRRAEQI